MEELKIVENNNTKKIDKVDLFWKARDSKPKEKSVDWYWVFWISVFIIIFISLYFFEDKIFAGLILLVAVVAVLGHRQAPQVIEYKINESGLILDNGKRRISFDEIEDFNIDYEDGYILINRKKKYEKLIQIPFEANHNITVIENILNSNVKRNEELQIPLLEKLMIKMLGF